MAPVDHTLRYSTGRRRGSAYRRRPGRSSFRRPTEPGAEPVVAVFTNTGTESVQNLLLCFSRRGSPGCALLSSARSCLSVFVQRNVWVVSSPSYGTFSPLLVGEEPQCLQPLIRGTGDHSAYTATVDYVAHAPFATGEKSWHTRPRTPPQSSYRVGAGPQGRRRIRWMHRPRKNREEVDYLRVMAAPAASSCLAFSVFLKRLEQSLGSAVNQVLCFLSGRGRSARTS